MIPGLADTTGGLATMNNDISDSDDDEFEDEEDDEEPSIFLQLHYCSIDGFWTHYYSKTVGRNGRLFR